MAIFYGTEAADRADRGVLSSGITTDPPGLTGVTDEGDLFYGFGGNDQFYGGEGFDTFYGGAGDDTLYDGWGGGALIHGEAGDDFLYAETGQLEGGTGDDTLYGGYDDTLHTAIADATLSGGAGDDWLEGYGGREVLLGGAGADYLYGNEGADVLRGGAGNDELVAEYYDAQQDTLIGGAGDDVFRMVAVRNTSPGDWNSTPAGFDLIRAEYGGAPAIEGVGVAGGDTIDVSEIDANTGTLGINNAFIFGGRGGGHLWLVENGSRTLVYGSTDGDPAAEFKLAIEDGDIMASDYVAEDFIL